MVEDEYKEYEVQANLVIETRLKNIRLLEEEILLALIDIVEKHDSFIGGGLTLKPYEEES